MVCCKICFRLVLALMFALLVLKLMSSVTFYGLVNALNSMLLYNLMTLNSMMSISIFFLLFCCSI